MDHTVGKHNFVCRKLLRLLQCFIDFRVCNFIIFVSTSLICMSLITVGSAGAEDEVAKAEAWFNQTKTIKADFVQVSSDGTSAEGKLLFRRPSQMRIAYHNEDGSRGMQLITSKIWLHVDRPDQKLVTSYPLSETPLSLILAPKVSLRPDGYETRVIPSSVGILQILISKQEGEGAGQLTLEFSEKPFQFRRWVVVDSVGIETSLTLFNLTLDTPIPYAEFRTPQYLPQN